MKGKIVIGLVLALVIAFGLWGISFLRADVGDQTTLGWDYTNQKDTWRVDSTGDLIPGTNNNVNIGSSSLKVKNYYGAGTLGVDGATTIGGTLGVTGTATFNGAVSITEGALTDASIVTADIKDSNVTTAKLAANAVTSAKLDEGTIKYAEVSLTNAQIKALTTPVVVVAAPGTGKVISFVDAIVIHDVGDADFATAHNVTINYKADGSGAAVSTTLADPFISGAVADKISTLKQLVTDITTADKTTQENQPLVIKASANPITGTGVGRVKVWYRVFATGL